MNRIKAQARKGAVEAAEKGLTHYDGVGMIGTDTLCGHVDRTEYQWVPSLRRVNCVGCIAVRNHVLGRPIRT